MIRSTARFVAVTVTLVAAVTSCTGCATGAPTASTETPTATRSTGTGVPVPQAQADLVRICEQARDAVTRATTVSFGFSGSRAAERTSARLRELAGQAPAGEVRTALEAFAAEISGADPAGGGTVPDPRATPEGASRLDAACARYRPSEDGDGDGNGNGDTPAPAGPAGRR